MPRYPEETKEYARALRRVGKTLHVISRVCGAPRSTVQAWVEGIDAHPTYHRRCRLCGTEFTATRRDATYCREGCSKRSRDVLGWKVYKRGSV